MTVCETVTQRRKKNYRIQEERFMKIGEQIREYRKNAGLTQEQVANYLGVTAPAVNKWERAVPARTFPYCRRLPGF